MNGNAISAIVAIVASYVSFFIVICLFLIMSNIMLRTKKKVLLSRFAGKGLLLTVIGIAMSTAVYLLTTNFFLVVLSAAVSFVYILVWSELYIKRETE